METAPVRIEIAPNCSLTVRGAALFFAGLCCVCLTIAATAAVQGYWPVLPFAGLELALLGWALGTSMRRQSRRQAITIRESRVHLESHDRAQYVEIVFPRHWAQVKLRRPSSGLHPSRLTIESHGRQCEVGNFLTEDERRGLALRLQGLIGRVNESPSLIGGR